MNYYKDIYNYLTNKFPNRRVFIISDQHFFHENIIKYERQQFSSVEDMNNHIINCHNETVNPDDIVIFLGDFSFKKNEIGNLLSKMNGHKFLIMGNHDKNTLINSYDYYGFEGVFNVPVKFENCILSHYPINSSDINNIHYQLLLKEFMNNEYVNYHGHVHNSLSEEKKLVNVCCEAVDYKPILIGKTGDKVESKTPYIFSLDSFEDVLFRIENDKNLSRNLIVSDYIYSIMLEKIGNLSVGTSIYGSYPQYKKYGYISNFSDLDVAILYNDNLSKKKNTEMLKELLNRIYSSLNEIDEVSLEFIKKYVNLSAFSYSFINGKGLAVNGALDVNLVPINFYKASDLVSYSDESTLEKYLTRYDPKIIEDFYFPKYTANFLTTEADISNLLLQILFQKGNSNKKNSAIKKLKYISKYFVSDIRKENLEDILVRFFLRNITFFNTLRRMNEIDHIKQLPRNFELSFVPANIKKQVCEILLSSDSYFNYVYNEINNTPNDEIANTSKLLLKK